jgi:hypothetical protein
MNSGQLETRGAQTARLVPVDPNVKSSKMRKLFNDGVSGNSKIGKTTDPTCYNAPVSRKRLTRRLTPPGCLTSEQERQMTSTKPLDMEARWSELEQKHNLKCLWSEVIGNRTIQVECMWVPSAGVTIMVTKHYEHPIPRSWSTKKPFPKMTAHYAYFPAGGVTWESMDAALASIKGEQTEDEVKEINAA